MENRLSRTKLSVQITICFAVLLFLMPTPLPATSENPKPTEITKKQLKVAAYNSLWRLKRAMERDGFFGAKVALNVWRSNAMDAGIFKQEEYDGYKTQIYEKSIVNSLHCYESSLEKENYTDAKICLRTWKSRTEELGKFDPDRYEEMKAAVEALKK
jgi:hypothetical protein